MWSGCVQDVAQAQRARDTPFCAKMPPGHGKAERVKQVSERLLLFFCCRNPPFSQPGPYPARHRTGTMGRIYRRLTIANDFHLTDEIENFETAADSRSGLD